MIRMCSTLATTIMPLPCISVKRHAPLILCLIRRVPNHITGIHTRYSLRYQHLILGNDAKVLGISFLGFQESTESVSSTCDSRRTNLRNSISDLSFGSTFDSQTKSFHTSQNCSSRGVGAKQRLQMKLVLMTHCMMMATSPMGSTLRTIVPPFVKSSKCVDTVFA